MNEPAHQDTKEQATMQEAVSDSRNLSSFREAQDDLVNRHSDAVTKINEAEDAIHDKKRELRKWEDHLAWQVKRRDALARRIKASREYIRSAEDDLSGVY